MSARPTSGLRLVLIVLFVTGWAANHFAAMLPELGRTEGLSTAVLSGAFGIYALGLLPGLFGGGTLSDRIGRRPVVLVGAITAALGNLAMLPFHHESGIFAGRLIVGSGVGLAVSAGTAWGADLGGRRGATAAGVALTAGFGTGPLVSGLIAQFAPTGWAIAVPFAVTSALSMCAVVLVMVSGLSATESHLRYVDPDAHAAPGETDRHRSMSLALAASVPMALWVFSTASAAFVVLAGRMHSHHGGPALTGLAAFVGLGAGAGVQMVARRRGWGAAAGVGGALLAALGFTLGAWAGATPSLTQFAIAVVVLGLAYGLCLREGLVDIEMLAPPAARGTVIGIFYVCTYLGFGLPLLLDLVRPAVGVVTPMVALAAAALAAAAIRTAHLRATDHLAR